MNELSCMASDIDPDIILVTETWCNAGISDAYLSLQGYELKSELGLDRGDTGAGRGGGLVVYAKNDLTVLKLDQAARHSQICKFSVSDVAFYLVYRPPSAPADSITELADIVRNSEKNCIFFGDFNLPQIDWEAGAARGRAEELLEAVQDKLMDQLVDFPTQVKGNTLDLVITNIPERVDEICEAGRLGKSDHTVITVKVSIGVSLEPEKSMPDWKRADWDAMREELRTGDWLQQLKRSGAARAWEILRAKMENMIEKYVPERRKRNNNRPAWMTQEILRAIRRKKRIWRTVRGGQITEEYREAEKKVRNLIRNSKRSFEKKLAAGGGGSNRPFFAYIKHKTQSRPSIGPLKNSEGETVSDSQGMAELLNTCFKEVFTKENAEETPEPDNLQTDTVLTSIQFRVQDVIKKIKNLKTEGAAGPDGFGPRVLQELQREIAPALAAIFTKSMEEGVVPADWRDANVTPIFKKGAKSTPSNYRPVSLTSVSCRVMESLIRDAITTHLTANKLIKNSQHGFLKDRSCVTNLLEFLEEATTVVDGGAGFDIIYLDFAKAFDKVPIKRLLKKVRAHGISGQILHWIESWLVGRRQRVVLNGKFSSWEDVLSGVPQGSVLGPLLFIIFINDMDEVVRQINILKKFADDTKLGKTVQVEKDREELQEALDQLCIWAEKWGMVFNVGKCKVMHMGHHNPAFSYTMNGHVLEETKEERDIGVIVSANMKPTAQCMRAAKTAQTVLGQLSRAFHYRDRHVFMRLYKQYVRPHLEFSTQAWAPWTEGDRSCLEKVQQRAVKMVSGLKSHVYEERLRELNLPTLLERRHQADMAMVHKILHGKGGLDHSTWFERAENGLRATRSTADPYNLKVKHGRLDPRRNFFSIRVIEDWNRIPADVKRVGNSESFKALYRTQRATQMDHAAR